MLSPKLVLSAIYRKHRVYGAFTWIVCNQSYSDRNQGPYTWIRTVRFITLHTFLVPMQCRGNSGCFPWGKRAAIVRCYLFFFFQFSFFHTTGCEVYSFTTDGCGIFNMRTHLGACCTHEGGSGTNKSAHQELTQRDKKKHLSLTLPHQSVEPRVFRPEL